MPTYDDTLTDLSNLKIGHLKKLKNEELCDAVAHILDVLETDRRENQILYYRPASERARKIHFSRAKWVGVSGGNGSSKTETCLVHFIALATGVFPQDEELNKEFKEQFRGPINARIVVESFTTTLYPIILPKLRYSTWTGVDEPGGERGHWGWIPKMSLQDGSWDKSWSEKTKMLTIRCHDPENGQYLGDSRLHFMSKDQDPEDFASGDFHLVLHDEPPLYAQWRESQARTMRVGGRIFLSFTWPDDPTIPVDWVYDELYDRAITAETKRIAQIQKGEKPDKILHEWFELWTTDNWSLDQGAIADQAGEWSEEVKRVRLFGKSMRFSSRIHPLFTDTSMTWCFSCKQPKTILKKNCETCGDDNFVSFCHVVDFERGNWPCVFLLDPHPRKPHMFMWVEVTPYNDLRVLADGELDDTPEELARHIFKFEEDWGLHVPVRLIDPNMARSPSSANRIDNWQDEFDKVGLGTELANNSSVGRKLVDEYLKVDSKTLMPRLIIHPRCQQTIHQLKRYVWADFKMAQEKDIKQTPREKYDDYPTLLKYLVNYNPQFNWLNEGAPVIHRAGTRRGAY